MAKVALYGFYISSASWRVRIGLALKGIQYEYKTVGLTKNGLENIEEYRKLNPAGVVPTLQIDDVYLNQSLPIIEYLNERYPDPPLLPKDYTGRAQVRAMAEVINSGIQPLQNVYVVRKLGGGQEEWRRHFVGRGFKALETMLEGTSGKYCYKDEITMADIFLVPQVGAAKRFNVDMGQFPKISRINESLINLPAFMAADPSKQPDFPDNIKD